MSLVGNTKPKRQGSFARPFSLPSSHFVVRPINVFNDSTPRHSSERCFLPDIRTCISANSLRGFQQNRALLFVACPPPSSALLKARLRISKSDGEHGAISKPTQSICHDSPHSLEHNTNIRTLNRNRLF